MDTKNTEFDADFDSVENVKKVPTKKGIRMKV